MLRSPLVDAAAHSTNFEAEDAIYRSPGVLLQSFVLRFLQPGWRSGLILAIEQGKNSAAFAVSTARTGHFEVVSR